MGAQAAGAVLQIGGTAMMGESAEDHKHQLERLLATIRDPNYQQLGSDYYNDLNANYAKASALSGKARSDELTQDLALREQVLPGIGKATRDELSAIAPLLRGELPPSVMAAYQRAGGASSMGAGFGGTGFGFLNTGLFGARGSLGAIQTGAGLLPSLMSTMPQISAPTTMQLLSRITDPTTRAQLGLQVQNTRLGLGENIANAPTRLDVWGKSMYQAGSSLMSMGNPGQQQPQQSNQTPRYNPSSSNDAGSPFGGGWNQSNGWDY